MAEISREVLRAQPQDVIGFIADYLEEKLVRRENRRLAEKVVDNVLDLSLDIVSMLEAVGIDSERAEAAMRRIREEFHRHFETKPDDERLREVFRERDVLERLVTECRFSETEARKASAIIEQAYKTYYYRNAYKGPHPPAKGMDWQQAAKHSLSIYAQCRPTKEEMEVAARRIQAAYRGYYTRKRELMDRQATVIQRAFRGHRNRLIGLTGEEPAATLSRERLLQEVTITEPQSETSDSASDEMLRLIQDTIDEPSKDVEELMPDKTGPIMNEDEAATLIQSVFRGHRKRIQGAPVLEPMDNDPASDEIHEAATLLQSTVRGHLARKKLQQETTRNQMATLLQSHARGYLARKRHLRTHPGDDNSPKNC
ncbi:AGAP002540-PA-like protein [Anopheles sinensis]|uniref:AGAP002540-PA-like protein n=1 Tax=Anopheles sinensis TaxID=74873 RepID=A0A084VBK5_ANOSI|nr:AGAP002540-PA-like protein [Anopheles sinensis]